MYNDGGGGDPPGYLSDMPVNASYHDYQEYIWLMGEDFDHFQDNLSNCMMIGVGMTHMALI